MGTDSVVVSHRRVWGTLSALLALTAALWIAGRPATVSPEHDAPVVLQSSQFYLGESRLQRGDLAGALEHLRVYQQQAEQLAAREPSNRAYRLAESYGHSNVAAIYQRQGKLQAADDSFRQSIVLQDTLLANAADDVDLTHRRAVCLMHRGLILRALGEPAQAERALDAALSAAEALTRVSPSNVRWQRDLAAAGIAAARLDLDLGRTSRAIGRLRASGAVLRGVLAGDPGAAPALRDAAGAHIRLAEALRADGDLAAASREIRAAATLLLKIPEGARDLETLRRLAAMRTESGAIAVGRGDRWQATIDYEAAAGLVRLSIPDSSDYDLLELWTRIMLALGRPFDVKQTFARLDAMGYREPTLMALRTP